MTSPRRPCRRTHRDPLFRADYAQGRDTHAVRRIRTDFLDVLHTAVRGDEPHPLDWTLSMAGSTTERYDPSMDSNASPPFSSALVHRLPLRPPRRRPGLEALSYATRQGARMFCESLVSHPFPDGTGTPSKWIKDQPWYLFLWRHDPTIQSMLVMLDAIHERFHDVDAATAWARLTDAENPAIWFLLLPLSGLGSVAGEDMRPESLCIKMNYGGSPSPSSRTSRRTSRRPSNGHRSAEFALKVDTTWSDLLWGLRGDDDLIDDEFVRYSNASPNLRVARRKLRRCRATVWARVRGSFRRRGPPAVTHLDFLFQALNVWVDRPIPDDV